MPSASIERYNHHLAAVRERFDANPALNETSPMLLLSNRRWVGVNGTTGIWLRNFSKFVSAKGKMFSLFTY